MLLYLNNICSQSFKINALVRGVTFTCYPHLINRNISPYLPDHTPLCLKRVMEKRTKAQANVTVRDEQATMHHGLSKDWEDIDLYLESITN